MSLTQNAAVTDHQTNFGTVASRYSPMLFRVALGRLRNVEDAEDAVQDALLSAYKNIGQFEGRSQLSSWLVRIVINAANMKLRSRPRCEFLSLDETPAGNGATLANQLVDSGPNPETICARIETQKTLDEALAAISLNLRLAFHIRAVSGYSTKESADALRITESCLKTRVRRARSAVRSHVNRAKIAHLAGGSCARKITIRVSKTPIPLTNSPSIPRRRRRREFHAEPEIMARSVSSLGR